VKRFFNSPQPLAFFGFLFTFLVTVAWRVPLQGPHFFGTAQAASPSPAPAPVPEPVAIPQPIPQPLPMTLPLPAAPMAVMAPAPTMLPAFAQAITPVETADATVATKKKGRHAHKIKTATAAAGGDNLAGLMSDATEGKTTTKKRAHRD